MHLLAVWVALTSVAAEDVVSGGSASATQTSTELPATAQKQEPDRAARIAAFWDRVFAAPESNRWALSFNMGKLLWQQAHGTHSGSWLLGIGIMGRLEAILDPYQIAFLIVTKQLHDLIIDTIGPRCHG